MTISFPASSSPTERLATFSAVDRKQTTTRLSKASVIDSLPSELLASVFSYLPMREVLNVQLCQKKFVNGVELAVAQKLVDAGVKGKNLAELRQNSKDFVAQNQAVRAELEAIDRVEKYNLSNTLSGARLIPAKMLVFVPRSMHVAKIVELSRMSNLAEKMPCYLLDRSGQKVHLGVRLNRNFLRAHVPIKKYLDELRQQKATLSVTRFSEAIYEKYQSDIQTRINGMRQLSLQGQRTAYVDYLPKLAPTVDGSTTYERFLKETSLPLIESALRLKGVGTKNDRVLGLDLRNKNIGIMLPTGNSLPRIRQAGLKQVDQTLEINLKSLAVL